MESHRTKKCVYLVAIVATLFNIQVLAVESEFLTPEMASSTFKKFTGPTLLTGSFQQIKIIKDIDVTLKTSGQFKIQKTTPENVTIFWQIEKPQPMKVCITPENIVMDNPLLKKKTTLKLGEISDQDGSGLSKLVHLLKLDPVEITSQFNIKLDNDSKLKAIIYPKQKDSYSFVSAKLELDGNKNLKQINLLENNNDTLEIKFIKTKEKNFKVGQIKLEECK